MEHFLRSSAPGSSLALSSAAMSSQNPYPPQNNASFPALHLYPLDDSFIPKRIALAPGQRVKIARPPNTKTQPGERNGYFDSRVLSRQHAEVWEEGNKVCPPLYGTRHISKLIMTIRKIYIKDVKSSNGTFINGERLSLEGRESEPYELKSDDILEFGVDIVSEDNKTVLHRKVVARVACVFPTRAGQQGAAPPLPHDQFATMNQAGAVFNGMAGPRRPQMPMIHQGLAGLGGMGGGGVRAPGRGLTLDHIFSRLQAELAKSRDTGHDLQVLTGALGNIEDTLNGALPPTSLPTFPDVLPGVRPPQPPPRAMSVPSLPSVPAVESPPSAPATDAVAELQAQLREHQEALAAHVEGIRALEGVLAEQEAMKREVRELREFVGVDRRGTETKSAGAGGDEGESENGGEELEDEEGEEDDNSDADSIMTARPRELDSVDEGEAEEEEEEGRFEFTQDAQRRELDAQADADALEEEREENRMRERAQTPEPTMDMADASPSPPRSPLPSLKRSPSPESLDPAPFSPSTLSLTELTARLTLLTAQLEAALAVSSALQAEHASAQATIGALEEKIALLEARPVAVPVTIPAAPTIHLDWEEMQRELKAVRSELTLERGRREAWAEGVEARMRQGIGAEVRLANGHAEDQLRRRHVYGRSASSSRSRSRSGSRSRGRSVSPGDEMDLGMDDSIRLEQLELGELEFKRPNISPVVSGLGAEKSLRAARAQQTKMNVQTALGVLILGIAAAAVLWRVKPE
ncbi:hypothetical protein B0H19DRAFT_177031 [Mycena capillaripes]|nr:hypothetical protein B0H19DRAFT_177031 [Mycena capillaripes]